MKPIFMLAAILLPILGGALIPLIPAKNRRCMMVYVESVVLLTSVLVW